MQSLHLIHLILISVWFGILLTEFLIELTGRDEEGLRATARLHYWIDLFFEIPVILGVIVTGLILLLRAWPPTPLLTLKLLLALIAIGLNLYCAVLVILRYRRREDPKALLHLAQKIHWTAAGVPFGLAAFYLGMAYFWG